MSDKYAVITLAKMAASSRSDVMSKLPDLADISRAAGSTRVLFGTVMTGLNTGSAIMIQFFEELNKLESVYSAFSESVSYQDLMSGSLSISRRNITTLNLSYSFDDAPNLKYTVLSRAAGCGSHTDIIASMEKAVHLFKDNGAKTFRFGRIMTGENTGDYLLGVSYGSMSDIEQTYDAIAESADAKNVYNLLGVNQRGIIQVGGVR